MIRHSSKKSSNEQCEDSLNIKKIQAYAVYSSDDERSGSIKGYYTNISVASAKAEKSGWYNSDGEVQSLILHTDGKYLYEVCRVGFCNNDEAEKEHMIASIKSKLSKEELKFLLNNSDSIG